MVAAHPQLQTGITAMVSVTGPLFRVLERVGNDVAHAEFLAERYPVIIGGHRDVVNLWSPSIVGDVLCVHVQEIVLHEFCKDGIFRVGGPVERVPAFAGSVGCRRDRSVFCRLLWLFGVDSK